MLMYATSTWIAFARERTYLTLRISEFPLMLRNFTIFPTV